MIVLRLNLVISSIKRKEFYQTISVLARKIRQEAGCVSHHWYRDLGNRNIFLLIEHWDTEGHLTDHLVSEDFGILFGALKTLGEQQSIQFTLTVEGGDKNCLIGDGAAMQNLRDSLYASLDQQGLDSLEARIGPFQNVSELDL